MDHNPLKKPIKRYASSKSGKKGRRNDLEDAGEISAEDTDEDNLDIQPHEEAKEVDEVAAMPSKGSTQKHAKEDDQAESIDTSSNRG